MASAKTAKPGRTRISVAERRAQILEATRSVAVRRGLHDLRVADVADELGISTGLVHYHFDTKDILIEAMLRASATESIASISASIADIDDPAQRLERAIEAYLPSPRRDQSWVIWIDVWGEALRDTALRRISEELDNAWVALFEDVITAGVAAGVFRTDDPLASAWRLCALLDGLGLQVVLHQSTMSRAQMRRHIARAAASELGYALA